MKYVDEFRNPEKAQGLQKEIAQLSLQISRNSHKNKHLKTYRDWETLPLS